MHILGRRGRALHPCHSLCVAYVGLTLICLLGVLFISSSAKFKSTALFAFIIASTAACCTQNGTRTWIPSSAASPVATNRQLLDAGLVKHLGVHLGFNGKIIFRKDSKRFPVLFLLILGFHFMEHHFPGGMFLPARVCFHARTAL